MGASARPSSRRRASTLVALLCLALAVLVIAPIGALAAPSNAPNVTIAAEPATGSLTATALWNGVNVATANTTTAAFHISFNGAVK